MSDRLMAVRQGGSNDGEVFGLRSNESNQLLTAGGLPPYVELSRRNRGFQVMDTSATAAVVVRPSTVAGLTLWNGSSDKVYAIDRVGAFNLVSTDAIAAWAIWGCVHPEGMTEPTADITAIKPYSGKHSSYSGAAVVDTGATVVDNGWFILQQAAAIGNPGTTTPGQALVADVEGRFLIPPTAGFSINVVASVTGYTFTHLIAWHELDITVE